MKNRLHTLLVDLLTLPTAPFNEQHVAGYIRRWAAGRPGMKLDTDEFGNLRVRLRRGPAAAAPLVFSGHMDHPGFEAQAMIGPRKLWARWRGSVQPEYFRKTRVRFHSDGQWVRGTVASLKIGADPWGRRRVQWVTAAVDEPVAPGSVGMWDLPDPTVKGTRLYARGCDDVAGVASIMAALEVLAGGRAAVDVYATFTRAEEVGFAGAIAAAHSGLIPRNARIVAVETSSEIPGVKMGDGPILRVGDRHAVFTPSLTAFCREVADDLAKRDKRPGRLPEVGRPIIRLRQSRLEGVRSRYLREPKRTPFSSWSATPSLIKPERVARLWEFVSSVVMQHPGATLLGLERLIAGCAAAFELSRSFPVDSCANIVV